MERLFFCYKCDVVVHSLNADYKCPKCNDGFLEELFINENNDQLAAVDNGNPRYVCNFENIENPANFGNFDNRGHIRYRINSVTPDSSANSGNNAVTMQRQNEPNGQPSEPICVFKNKLRAFLGTHNRADIDVEAELSGDGVNLINHLLSMASAHNGADDPQYTIFINGAVLNVLFIICDSNDPLSTSNLFTALLNNLDDYVSGAIEFHGLLREIAFVMDPLADPPLPAWQMDMISKIEISAAHIDNNPKCCICYEDFNLKDTARELSCSHIYHEQCILKWMKSRGNCPACRNRVQPE